MFRAPVIFISILTLSACYYDSEEFLFPEVNTDCDTTAVTFSGSVKPILEQYCLRCHSNSNANTLGSGFKLQDHSNVQVYANNGSLYGSITHMDGYVPMPHDGGKLNNCDIAIIKSWIDDGSPNN